MLTIYFPEILIKQLVAFDNLHHTGAPVADNRLGAGQ